MKVPLFIILISPLIRILSYFLIPEIRGQLTIMTHTRFDSLIFGCLLACIYNQNMFSKFNPLIHKYKLHWLSIIHLLFISRIMQVFFQGKYQLTIGYTLDCFFICMLIVYLVENKSVLSKLLNLPILVHFGTLSYSLYLWQQPFTWYELGNNNVFLRVILIYVCALTSYMLIENPFMMMRKKFLKSGLSSSKPELKVSNAI